MQYEQKSSSGNTKTLMVMLHGLGSNGDDLFSLVPYFASHMPDAHFFSPDGIEVCDMFGYGYQWFSLQDRSHESITKELERVAPLISQMIEEKAMSLGLTKKDVILLGFSQGTMVSLYLALTSNAPYKAVLGFSGRLFMPNNVTNTKTPICLVHGAEDFVVPSESLGEATSALSKLEIKVSDLMVPDLVHSIDMNGIKFALEFVNFLTQDNSGLKGTLQY
ncbi:MAG: hypothetical protein RLZZ59_650 [Pseudomonadota bacterium]